MQIIDNFLAGRPVMYMGLLDWTFTGEKKTNNDSKVMVKLSRQENNSTITRWVYTENLVSGWLLINAK